MQDRDDLETYAEIFPSEVRNWVKNEPFFKRALFNETDAPRWFRIIVKSWTVPEFLFVVFKDHVFLETDQSKPLKSWVLDGMFSKCYSWVLQDVNIYPLTESTLCYMDEHCPDVLLRYAYAVLNKSEQTEGRKTMARRLGRTMNQASFPVITLKAIGEIVMNNNGSLISSYAPGVVVDLVLMFPEYFWFNYDVNLHEKLIRCPHVKAERLFMSYTNTLKDSPTEDEAVQEMLILLIDYLDSVMFTDKPLPPVQTSPKMVRKGRSLKRRSLLRKHPNLKSLLEERNLPSAPDFATFCFDDYNDSTLWPEYSSLIDLRPIMHARMAYLYQDILELDYYEIRVRLDPTLDRHKVISSEVMRAKDGSARYESSLEELANFMRRGRSKRYAVVVVSIIMTNQVHWHTNILLCESHGRDRYVFRYEPHGITHRSVQIDQEISVFIKATISRWGERCFYDPVDERTLRYPIQTVLRKDEGYCTLVGYLMIEVFLNGADDPFLKRLIKTRENLATLRLFLLEDHERSFFRQYNSSLLYDFSNAIQMALKKSKSGGLTSPSPLKDRNLAEAIREYQDNYLEEDSNVYVQKFVEAVYDRKGYLV